ncbi:hypothetical protein KUCAC02_026537, partial [Chaenocephalus aceratus]
MWCVNTLNTLSCASELFDIKLQLCANYQAYFGQGTKVTVLEPGRDVSAPTVTVFPPSAKECRNQRDRERRKTLVCVASGFYPDHVGVSWQVGGGAVSSGVATDSSALREGKTYRISSRLRVSASDWFTPDRKFTCRVSFFNGTHTSHHENTVEGVQGAQAAMTREKYLKTTQAAKTVVRRVHREEQRLRRRRGLPAVEAA